MGDVILLAERRAARRRAAQMNRREPGTGPIRCAPPVFFFDLSSPFAYLAAERVERLLGTVQWRPASAEALQRGGVAADHGAVERLRDAAARRAAALQVPLVWPDGFPRPALAAMRAAAYAADSGRGAAFALAASRLAYCGGFDLDDPEVLAEAAAAAGIGLEHCLRAAGDVTRDGALEATGRRLLALGADRLPAVRVRQSLFCGEDRLAEAAASARDSDSDSAGAVAGKLGALRRPGPGGGELVALSRPGPAGGELGAFNRRGPTG